MPKPIPNCFPLVVLLMGLLALSSCNTGVVDVPFPENGHDSIFPQPVSIPLHFSTEKKIEIITTKSGSTIPVIKKLDIDALPAVRYGTDEYQPVTKTPDVIHFDYNTLPDTVFDLGKITAKPLRFKTSVLPAPIITKSSPIVPKTGTAIAVSEIGLAQGLPDKSVICELKDKKGFIWIGTNKSLYRYGGEFMETIGAITTGVVGLAEDADGKIWFINDSEIGWVDQANGLISRSGEVHLQFPELPKMTLDEKGMIWIPLRGNRGIYLIDTKHETYQTLDRSAGITGRSNRGVFEDGKKNIWILTNDGVNIINNERNKIRYLRSKNGLYSDTSWSITGDDKGRTWIAFSKGTINAVDLEQGTITNFGKLPGGDYSYSFNLLYDDIGRLWIATEIGLWVFDTENKKVRNFRSDNQIPGDQILNLIQDDKKRIWVATFTAGLLMIEQNGDIVHPVATKSLSTLFEDERGRIWIGTGFSQLGIQIIDPDKKTTSNLTMKEGLPNNFIQNIIQVDGEIWIATDGGIDLYDKAKKILRHIGKKEGLASDTVYGTLKDRNGRLWIAGPSAGIDIVDLAHNTIMHTGAAQGLSEDNIVDLKQDEEGRIWVATYSKGIDLIDPVKSTVKNLREGAGLSDTSFRILLKDRFGRIWIGTDKGIYIADTKHGNLTTLTTREGLSNNFIVSMLPYKDNIVVGTQNKVSTITIKNPDDNDTSNAANKWKIDVVEGSEGLIDASAVLNSWNTNIITSKGQYFWATNAGITVINNIRKQTSNPSTYITGVAVLNEPQYFANKPTPGEKDTLWSAGSFFVKGQLPANASFTGKGGMLWDSVSGPYNTPVNLSLPYDKDYLQFQYAQTDIGTKEVTLYSYILEGIDKHWSPLTTKTATENYMNLAPGKYIFKVRGKGVSGLWGKPASLAFTITPPWWKSWWMYLVYLIALAGAFYGYNKYRSAALLKENRILEEKVLARTQEVKQQADELATVNQISQALVSQADLNDLIQLVGNQLRDLFKANIVYIGLLDKKTKIISFPYQYGDAMPPLKLGEGLTSKIILTGDSLLINKDVHEQASSFGIGRVGLPASSYLGVPIPVSDEIIGVLSIQSTEKENRFAEKDQHLLSTIAASVGVAIKKARLFEEVKQANTDADVARKSAEEANAAKSAFLSTVSHELRTPLTSVLGFAKIIKKRLEEKIFPLTEKSDPKIAKTIEQISGNLQVVISEGERLTNLINDVLDLAKIEAGKMEWNMEGVHVPDIVDRAIAATSALFDQKNLKLDKKISADLPEVSGDRDKLIQVVVNLLSNAVKFTKEGAVTCSVFQKDGGIVVGITDTGIGIAPEDHDKVFEQFKQVGDTLTDKPKGTGLGLPICKEIIEHHNGKIWLESELGQGSTFYFMLPPAKTDEAAIRHIQLDDLLRQLKKRVEQSRPVVPGKTATILVVDDDDGIRSLLKQELTEAGYNVEEASDGKQAVTKIRSLRPDLVILDVMMPEMNGFDVAAILKNDPQTMEIPIIILSIVADKSRGFRIGVDRYLTKPIDTALLFSEIGNLLEQGKSRKKVLVVDEDTVTVRSLTDVLQAKGYQVVESDGHELVEKAIATQPDIIILNSVISDKHEIVKTLRFEKGLENVLFLIYQ